MRPRVILWIILGLTFLALWVNIPPIEQAPTLKILGKKINFLGIFPLPIWIPTNTEPPIKTKTNTTSGTIFIQLVVGVTATCGGALVIGGIVFDA